MGAWGPGRKGGDHYEVNAGPQQQMTVALVTREGEGAALPARASRVGRPSNPGTLEGSLLEGPFPVLTVSYLLKN